MVVQIWSRQYGENRHHSHPHHSGNREEENLGSDSSRLNLCLYVEEKSELLNGVEKWWMETFTVSIEGMSAFVGVPLKG